MTDVTEDTRDTKDTMEEIVPSVAEVMKQSVTQWFEKEEVRYGNRQKEALEKLISMLSSTLALKQPLEAEVVAGLISDFQAYFKALGKPAALLSFSSWSPKFIVDRFGEYPMTKQIDQEVIQYLKSKTGTAEITKINDLHKLIRLWLKRLSIQVPDSEEITGLELLEIEDRNEAEVRLIVDLILHNVLEIVPNIVVVLEDAVKKPKKPDGISHGYLDYGFYFQEDTEKLFVGLIETKRGKEDSMEQGRSQTIAQLITKSVHNYEVSTGTKITFGVATNGFRYQFFMCAKQFVYETDVYCATCLEDLIEVISVMQGLIFHASNKWAELDVTKIF